MMLVRADSGEAAEDLEGKEEGGTEGETFE